MNQDNEPAPRTEAELEKLSVEFAELYGIICYKFVSPGVRGVPDHIFIFPGGETIYVEFKHPDGSGRLSKLQLERKKEIEGNGAVWYECDSYSDFQEIVFRHLRKRR